MSWKQWYKMTLPGNLLQWPISSSPSTAAARSCPLASCEHRSASPTANNNLEENCLVFKAVLTQAIYNTKLNCCQPQWWQKIGKFRMKFRDTEQISLKLKYEMLDPSRVVFVLYLLNLKQLDQLSFARRHESLGVGTARQDLHHSHYGQTS
jgi:hypothetical protein